MLVLTVFGISLLGGCGSRPSDISSITDVQNPLPACPDSPNCIRITKQVDLPIDQVFTVSKHTLQDMGAIKLKTDNDYKINSVFRVFFFKDDLVLQCTKRNPESTYLHIRSASRVGYSDLGVNRRRVNHFLRKLQRKLRLSEGSH